MAESVTGIAIYMQPGMTIQIRAPIQTRDHFGWFAAKTPPEDFFDGIPANSSLVLTRGFAVENEDVGSIVEATDDDGAAVKYTHKVGADNTIWFFSVTEEIGAIKIIAVPIHDHSSIVQGGPAYGTYFDDDEEA